MGGSLFANVTPDPVKISLEYLGLCRDYPNTATMQTIQTHVRHFVDHQWYAVHYPVDSCPVLIEHCSGRRPWFNKFRGALAKCESVDAIETLLRVKVQHWRSLPPLSDIDVDDELEESDTGEGGGGRLTRDETAIGGVDVDEAFAGLSILS